MILVLVGTNPYSFERLVAEVDRLAAEKKADFFVQLGNTPFEPSHCLFERFIDKDIILKKMAKADVIICHGGFGSIRDALATGKVPIVVPRLPEKSECNDYQVELVKELEEEGRIIAVYDINDLAAAIEKAPHTRYVGGEGNRIPGIIQNFIDQF